MKQAPPARTFELRWTHFAHETAGRCSRLSVLVWASTRVNRLFASATLTQLNHYLLALLRVGRLARTFFPLPAPPFRDFACGLEPESSFVTRAI